ncbi:serine protease [Serratia sp. S4]|uniref:S1 family peptidase n=1 Tax=Serratia sp. S4 TaxID=768491 RepID=UPI0003A662F0|nr:serine protease [Serratia sp. S4]
MKNSKTFQTKIEYPDTNDLDKDCQWLLPEFLPYDGIVEGEIWALNGLIVAIGIINSEEQKILGSGVMIAPGICLTATHVVEETFSNQAIIYTFPCESSMRMWCPQEFDALKTEKVEILFQQPQEKFSDVSIMSCSPLSKFNDNEPYVYVPIEVALPKIGERLWAAGYREVNNDGTPTISFYSTSGLVTEQYSQGRGSYIQGACVEVAMKALGGMSGGPVFNKDGRVVGVISSCLEGHDDDKGPTYVTLIWPSLVSVVSCTWPNGMWPDNIAGLQVETKSNGARVLGGAVRGDDGSIRVKFPTASSEEIHEIFKKAGDISAINNAELQDYIYSIFSTVLEDEGLSYLGNLSQEMLNKIDINHRFAEKVKLFESISAETFDGIEDISIYSAVLLESGSIGLDVLYDIRGAYLTLKMDKNQYLYLNKEHEFSEGFHNYMDHNEFITYQHYVRPYFRVTLTYNPKSEDFSDVRFHLVVLK